MERVEEKVDDLIATNFTKSDMEMFKRDICSPSRECQKNHEERIQKTEKFHARIGGMFAAVTIVWGAIVVIFEILMGRK